MYVGTYLKLHPNMEDVISAVASALQDIYTICVIIIYVLLLCCYSTGVESCVLELSLLLICRFVYCTSYKPVCY